MKIKSAEYILSVAALNQLPDTGLPEIAFSGRSNVGKSSLANKILNRRKLFKTSSTPGKTRLLNYFLINEEFYFVDLPGYGYAKVSKSMRESWARLIESYLERRETLHLVVQLVDMRIPPQKSDMQMTEYLRYYDIPFCLVATKTDKVKRRDLNKNIAAIKKSFGVEGVIPFSAVTGLGADRLWSAITHILQIENPC
ncbi:MAG: YihA family ribosome biogenesis GTP-binding protein [Candidatus Cloacimonetes bacterium 4572_55]|nr:MAG: YihA family ribosome biogenesis GTP-binding protein [Candidatus Cloacimonetes bacterium 4572_55]